MADMQKRWVKEYKPGFADRIGHGANGPLKPRIVGGVRMIRMQNNKLGAIISRLEHHEKSPSDNGYRGCTLGVPFGQPPASGKGEEHHANSWG